MKGTLLDERNVQMNLVYFLLVILVLVAVLIDSMTLIFMVIATIMLLPGCGSQIPTASCTINGEDCHAQQDPDIQGPQGNDGPTGPQGPSAPAGRDGTNGTDGTDGAGGKTGNAGKDCTVVQGIGGATISCGDGTSAVITNGSSTVVQVVDPCGSQSTKDDTLLVIGGKVYGIVTTSNKTFLTDLVPGVYTTRDGTNCHYIVHTNATITW